MSGLLQALDNAQKKEPSYRVKLHVDHATAQEVLDQVHVPRSPSDDAIFATESEAALLLEEESISPEDVEVSLATSRLHHQAKTVGGPPLAEAAMVSAISGCHHYCDITNPDISGAVIPNPQKDARGVDAMCQKCGIPVEIKRLPEGVNGTGPTIPLHLNPTLARMLLSDTLPLTTFVGVQVARRFGNVWDVDSWNIDSTTIFAHRAAIHQAHDQGTSRTVLHIPTHLWTQRLTRGDTMTL